MDPHEALTTGWGQHPLAAREADLALHATVTMDAYAPRAARLDVATLPVISLALDAATSPSGRVEDVADLRVVSVLGEGGMGRVLLARQRSLRREVAVKTLRAEAADERAKEALLREGEVMGSLEHPRIVPVHALGRDRDGLPVLVMKRIEGVTLEALLGDVGHPSWTRWMEATGDRHAAIVAMLMEVCDALEFAHRQGVIHRDVKPANVLLGPGGEVYLGDWGVAAQRGGEIPAVVVGTPLYMAPEMAAADTSRLSPRTDVYLLGATLHAALTGKPRHTATTLQQALVAALRSEPVVYGDDVPADLAALCNEATHREPEHRPESALTFRRRLGDHLRHRASIALAREGNARLDALVPLLAAPRPDLAAVHRVSTECRYAFEQSLREWPDNPEAKAGRVHCLEALFAFEVRRENADAAEALARELGLSDAHRAAIATLRETLDGRRASAEEATREARERDLSVGSSQRRLLMAMLAVITGAAFSLFVWTFNPSRATTFMIGVPLGAMVVLGAVAWRMRDNIMATRVSRQLVGLLLVGLAWITVHRAAVVLSAPDADPARVIAEDLYMLTGMSLIAALAIRREFAWCALVMAGGAFATLVAPRWNVVAFTLATLSGPALTFALLSRAARSGDTGPASLPPDAGT